MWLVWNIKPHMHCVRESVSRTENKTKANLELDLFPAKGAVDP
jgi:hypothetical protein